MKDQLIVSAFIVCLTITVSGCTPQKTMLLRAEGSEICEETKSEKMWQKGKGGPFLTLQEAEQYAADLQLGGYNDWRLPSKEELFHLYHVFFWKKNNNCDLNQSGEFWSVAKDGRSSLGHWETYFLCDPEFNYVKSLKTSGYVRAIRP